MIFLCRFYENTSLCHALSRPRSNLNTHLTLEFTLYPLHPETFQGSANFERTFWFFRFSKKTNEKFLPQEARAKICVFKFVFWENWRRQTDISKLLLLFCFEMAKLLNKMNSSEFHFSHITLGGVHKLR